MSALLVNTEEAPGCAQRRGCQPSAAATCFSSPASPGGVQACSRSCSKPGWGGNTCAFGEDTFLLITVNGRDLFPVGSDGRSEAGILVKPTLITHLRS